MGVSVRRDGEVVLEIVERFHDRTLYSLHLCPELQQFRQLLSLTYWPVVLAGGARHHAENSAGYAGFNVLQIQAPLQSYYVGVFSRAVAR